MGLMDVLRGEKRTRVQMIVSVGDHVAGRTYDLPVELADRYVARGYAAGALSRNFDPDELQALKGNPQVVKLGG